MILDAALFYLAFLVCVVAVMRATKARNHAERDADRTPTSRTEEP
ncbi:hypothetical protein [Embleya sp. NPDC005971]